MASGLVEISIEKNVSILYLNHHPNNLLNNQLLDEIEKASHDVQESGARAVLFLSKLKHFSGGADPSFLENEKPSERNPMRLINIMEDIEIPTVAGINGAALGGGFELALGCDLIIAADNASIGLVEASVGLMPLSGGTQRVVQRAGIARGKEIAMLGRRYDANTLEKWGVINLVVPEETLHSAAISLAQQLANGPTVALKEIKKVANNTAKKGILEGDNSMPDAIKNVLSSSDAASGISFLAQKSDSILFKGK